MDLAQDVPGMGGVMDLVQDVGEGEKKVEGGESKVGNGQQQEQEETNASLKGTESNRPAPMTIPMAAPAAQLTIFYAGAVSVYNAVPPEKAQAIMLIAAAAAATATATTNIKNTKIPMMTACTHNAAAASPFLTRSLSLQSSSAAVAGTAARVAASPQPQLFPNPNSSHCKLQAVLPVARRHSLQRFLEKRRDRLVSKAPYPSEKTSGGMETSMEMKSYMS